MFSVECHPILELNNPIKIGGANTRTGRPPKRNTEIDAFFRYPNVPPPIHGKTFNDVITFGGGESGEEHGFG
jgi:hypothetical protein